MHRLFALHSSLVLAVMCGALALRPGLLRGAEPDSTTEPSVTEPSVTEPSVNPRQAIQRHLQARDFAQAESLAIDLLSANPADQDAHWWRGLARAGLRTWPAALQDFDWIVDHAPDSVAVRQQRGITRFLAGQLEASLQDFDRAIELDPTLERKHWQRGIVQYLLGQYGAGADQFALYQTYYGADVENVVWHMACLARHKDWQSAREQMLTLTGQDRRIPLMTVDRLFREQAQPEDVLHEINALQDDDPDKEMARFYAQLYLALYHDARHDEARRNQHLAHAVALKQDHYMWDVARVWSQHEQSLSRRTAVEP